MQTSKELRKIALAKLEGFNLDWLREYADVVPDMVPFILDMAAEIDKERELA